MASEVPVVITRLPGVVPFVEPPDLVHWSDIASSASLAESIIAALKGYKTVFVMPDKMSNEKIQLLRAYGAKVIITPTAVAPEDPRSYYNVAEKIVAETPNAILANQYHNPENPRSHYLATGPEIWQQTGGQITDFVVGMGTGGTISGVGKYLKEKNPEIEIIAVEPSDSPVLSGGNPGPHKIQGIGAGFIPCVLNTKIYDRIITVTNEQAIEAARDLAKREGILAGISAGAACHVAVELSKQPENAGKTIVFIMCDTGERYLSTDLYAHLAQ